MTANDSAECQCRPWPAGPAPLEAADRDAAVRRLRAHVLGARARVQADLSWGVGTYHYWPI